MAKGSRAAIKSARRKGMTALAWASFGVAIVGGNLAAGMWLGTGIETVLEALPWEWLPSLLLLVGVVAVAIDLFIDGTPNQVAIAAAILIPSVATAAKGKLGDKIGEWTGALTDWISNSLVEWVGTNSAVGLAIACIVCSILMARRVIKKSGKSSALAEV